MNMTRDDFIRAAKEERWDWVDKNLVDNIITREDLNWAAHTADLDKDDNVRDLAATYWVISNLAFEQGDERHLCQWMMGDSSEIVRLRLAIALYKRGVREEHVIDFYWKALAHDEESIRKEAEKYRPTV